ncbi:Glu/Leu/Phe/Val family dehydrogenase [Spiribacter halobius]|nr:Glu/Leu/Phe/Val dehydrogenase dimerization domain-containing protein [Spiribacter halobius]UEX79443.1 amino acid dehydrogenase [Spiribacter halobius]
MVRRTIPRQGDAMEIFGHPDFDGHEQVVFGSDTAAGLRAIIAIHNTHRGPAMGGCRVFPYAGEAAALRDVLRLSRGMTYKSALAELPVGGGKAVVMANPGRDKTPALLAALGRLIDSLGGRYVTAEDSGTTVADLRTVAQETPHVTGIRERRGLDGGIASGDPSPATAYGVFLGLQVAVAHRLGRGLEGLTVSVQGLGAVGWRLAEQLRAAGARLQVSDIDGERVARAVRELDARPVAPEDIATEPADVLAPCALGGVLNASTVAALRVAVVAGAANNQLDSPAEDEALRRRGILYAPDYAINAGGIIDVAFEHLGDYDAASVRRHIERIPRTLDIIFRRADAEGLPTGTVADRLAEERFRAGAR